MVQKNRLGVGALPYFRTRGLLASLSLVSSTTGLYHAREWFGWGWDPSLFYLTYLLALSLAGHYLFIKPRRMYDNFSYAEETDVLTICSGVFVYSTVTIPYSRIQHTQTEQGPLLRHFGLARVIVFTAGSVYVIPALASGEAHALRVRLSEETGESL